MTKGTEQQLKRFIKEALEFHSMLNSVPHDPDLTPEEHDECLGWRPFSDACVGLAHTFRRMIWKAWAEQRKAERARAAEKRKRQRHGRKPKTTR